jgi:phosphoribosylanthranilate isomerase
MTDVKICGLTRPEDVELACSLGAAYVGFTFAAGSPRRVSLETARELAVVTARGVLRVGVFIDESPSEIAAAVDAGRLDLVQLHRKLHPKDLEDPCRPVIAVARVVGAAPEVPPESLLSHCRGLLFDTAYAGRVGGTGRTFDWSLLERRSWPVPVFLAGGLNSSNVFDAIAKVRPAVVDVASGVEHSPGVKDRPKLRRFFEEVRRADAKA